MVPVDIRRAADIHQAVDIHRAAARIRPVVRILTAGHRKDWLAEVAMVGRSHHTGLADSGLDPD